MLEIFSSKSLTIASIFFRCPPPDSRRRRIPRHRDKQIRHEYDLITLKKYIFFPDNSPCTFIILMNIQQ